MAKVTVSLCSQQNWAYITALPDTEIPNLLNLQMTTVNFDIVRMTFSLHNAEFGPEYSKSKSQKYGLESNWMTLSD